jgi:urease gamma subunit
MPRSQSVKLNKTTATEVTSGEFDSGVVKTQQFASVKAVKTPGQELAEAVGMAAKGATSIFESRSKSIENEEIINWSLYGDQVGRKLIEDLADVPLDQRSDHIKGALEEFRGDFEKYSDGQGVSAGGFRAGFGAFTEYVSAGEQSISAAKLKIKTQRAISGISTNIKTMVREGKSLPEIMKYAAGNKELFFNDRDAQVEVVRVMSEVANVAMNQDPMMDIEPFIADFMSGKSMDGSIDLYSIKEIKNIVDNTRKDHRINRQVFSSKTLENKKAIIKDGKIRSMTDVDKWDAEKVLTPAMYDSLSADVAANLSEYQSGNRDTYYTGIIEGTHGIKDLKLALDREEITVPQHNSLTAEYHSNVARQSEKHIFQVLTADLGANMTVGRYRELLDKKNVDGGLIYKPASVTAAYKAVLQNDYNRIARGGFQDVAGLNAVFANRAPGMKIDSFEQALGNLTVTLDGKPGQTIQDVINSSLSSTQKNALIYTQMERTAQLVNVARTNGYSSAGITNFEKDFAILRAELTINSNEGLQNFTQGLSSPNRDRLASAPEIQRAMRLHTGDLYDEGDAEFRIIQAPYMSEIYNTIRNRDNSSEKIAAEQTAEFIRRTMVQVDVQGSGVTDDQIWVSRESGITDQESFDHVAESLAQYFGIEDNDLQLYNTNPANPKSRWLFRNLNSEKSVKVPLPLLRALAKSNETNWRQAFISHGYPEQYAKPKEKNQLDFQE